MSAPSKILMEVQSERHRTHPSRNSDKTLTQNISQCSWDACPARFDLGTDEMPIPQAFLQLIFESHGFSRTRCNESIAR